jgi:hypothetical protein
MDFKPRKICHFVDQTHFEGNWLEKPYIQVAAAAVFRNPWIGRGFVADLTPEVIELAPLVGRRLAEDCVNMLGGADRVACFGKAGMVGLNGELEHCNVMIHTVAFGNPIRGAIGGSTWMVSSQKRGAAGAALEIPVAHKTEDRDQTSYHSIEIRIADAPFPDELMLCVAMTNSVRPNARVHRGGPVAATA